MPASLDRHAGTTLAGKETGRHAQSSLLRTITAKIALIFSPATTNSNVVERRSASAPISKFSVPSHRRCDDVRQGLSSSTGILSLGEANCLPPLLFWGQIPSLHPARPSLHATHFIIEQSDRNEWQATLQRSADMQPQSVSLPVKPMRLLGDHPTVIAFG